MAKTNKSETRSPVERIRIRAFACSLVGNRSDTIGAIKPTPSQILNALAGLKDPKEREKSTVGYWLDGTCRPKKDIVDAAKKKFPNCDRWLTPEVHFSPIHRFLCALDIWTSARDSSLRSPATTTGNSAVGGILAILSKRWIPSPLLADDESISLDDPIAKFLPHGLDKAFGSIYQPNYPLSLMVFMFRCGPYLQLSEKEFAEWAIDFASLTVVVNAFFQTLTDIELFRAGRECDYSALAHRILFRGRGTWPNYDAICEVLEDYQEFSDSSAVANTLLRVRGILEKELFAIGTNLSIVDSMAVPGPVTKSGLYGEVPKPEENGKRASEEEILAVLKAVAGGARIVDVCRKHGISDSTYYNWKTKFSEKMISKA